MTGFGGGVRTLAHLCKHRLTSFFGSLLNIMDFSVSGLLVEDEKSKNFSKFQFELKTLTFFLKWEVKLTKQIWRNYLNSCCIMCVCEFESSFLHTKSFLNYFLLSKCLTLKFVSVCPEIPLKREAHQPLHSIPAHPFTNTQNVWKCLSEELSEVKHSANEKKGLLVISVVNWRKKKKNQKLNILFVWYFILF